MRSRCSARATSSRCTSLVSRSSSRAEPLGRAAYLLAAPPRGAARARGDARRGCSAAAAERDREPGQRLAGRRPRRPGRSRRRGPGRPAGPRRAPGPARSAVAWRASESARPAIDATRSSAVRTASRTSISFCRACGTIAASWSRSSVDGSASTGVVLGQPQPLLQLGERRPGPARGRPRPCARDGAEPVGLGLAPSGPRRPARRAGGRRRCAAPSASRFAAAARCTASLRGGHLGARPRRAGRAARPIAPRRSTPAARGPPRRRPAPRCSWAALAEPPAAAYAPTTSPSGVTARSSGVAGDQRGRGGEVGDEHHVAQRPVHGRAQLVAAHCTRSGAQRAPSGSAGRSASASRASPGRPGRRPAARPGRRRRS